MPATTDMGSMMIAFATEGVRSRTRRTQTTAGAIALAGRLLWKRSEIYTRVAKMEELILPKNLQVQVIEEEAHERPCYVAAGRYVSEHWRHSRCSYSPADGQYCPH